MTVPRVSSDRTLGARAFFLTFVPLAALACPLAWHRSPRPEIGPYSRLHAGVLAVALLTCLLLAARASRLAVASGRLRGIAPVLTPPLAVATALAAIEITLQTLDRFGFGPTPFDAYRRMGHKRSIIFGFEARPNTRFTAAGARYWIDGRGFRYNPDLAPGEEAVSRRIAVVGESSVFGYGLNDGETWPVQLQRLLRKATHQRIAVINAGNFAHRSLQVLLRYYLRVRGAAPQWVVFYAGANDVIQSAVPEDRLFITDDILFTPSLGAFRWRSQPEVSPYFRTLLWAYVEAIVLGGDIVTAPEPAAPPGEEAAVTRLAVERYGRHVRTLVDMCRRDGVRLVLVTFLHDVPGLPGRELDAFNEELRVIAREEGLPLVDVARDTGPSPKGRYLFGDRYHPTPHGAVLIASRVAAGMAPLLRAAP